MECSICLEPMQTPFYLTQCTHGFHSVCIMKALDTYLQNHGTHWQTVPCPICRKRISYHIILKTFVQTCTLEEAHIIINDNNLHTKCHLDMSLLHVAAMSGNIPVSQYLIDKGLPVDEPNYIELTPVYLAAAQGKTDMVKYLVEKYNININKRNILYKTVLDIAIENNHHDTVAFLESKHAERSNPSEHLNLQVGDNTSTYVRVLKAMMPILL